MKDIITSWAICSLVLLTAMFFGFAFAEWNVNPGLWTETTRATFAALFLALELIVTILALNAAMKINAE